MLEGFGFSGYRSFGDELSMISPLKKVNFIIGKNNSGKSNVISFLKNNYSTLIGLPTSPSINHLAAAPFIDQHQTNGGTAVERIVIPLFKKNLTQHIRSLTPNHHGHPNLQKRIEEILLCSELPNDENTIWFPFNINRITMHRSLDLDFDAIQKSLQGTNWSDISQYLISRRGGELIENVSRVLLALCPKPDAKISVEIIPAIRQAGAYGSEASDFSGTGIINRLAEVESPTFEKLDDKAKFDSINKFLQAVTEEPSSEIIIPHDRKMLMVRINEKTLPLSSLGTGIHEIIIIAVAATLLTDTIVCIEEPELHLHPLLQKKLIQYLADKTTNQYIFTTHSAHLLDSTEAQIFHVRNDGKVSDIEAILNNKQRTTICNDLGYKASDLLQANCVIWVEGPSDRIYLNYWMNDTHPNLIEGTHYSIMFYGGKLLSHLSGDGELDYDELNNLISLKKLNRNSAIILDSDKSKEEDDLNKTKHRLIEEFQKDDGVAWVTMGREVENYLDDAQVEKSVTTVHPLTTKTITKGVWANLLEYIAPKSGNKVSANKVKVAHDYVANNEVNIENLDLKEKLHQLCDFIEKANNLGQ